MKYSELKALVASIRDADISEGYEYLGVRTQEMPFTLGKMDHCSREWNDHDYDNLGLVTELDGVCCTSIDSDAMRMHCDDYDSHYGFYYGDHMAVIAGNDTMYGADYGELIINDPVVIYIIK